MTNLHARKGAADSPYQGLWRTFENDHEYVFTCCELTLANYGKMSINNQKRGHVSSRTTKVKILDKLAMPIALNGDESGHVS
jgi:hypothetical protein